MKPRATRTQKQKQTNHNGLGLALGVDLSIVKRVDARVAARLEQLLGVLCTVLVAKRHPRAKRERADLLFCCVVLVFCWGFAARRFWLC